MSYLKLEGDYEPSQGVTTEVLKIRLEYKGGGTPAWTEASSRARNGNEWEFRLYGVFSPLVPTLTDLRLVSVKDSNGEVIWKRKS